MTERIDDGINRGAPLANLTKAVADAKLTGFEVWQGGPELSFVSQARVVLPAFKPRWLIPHHMGNRGSFDLLGGLHYAYVTSPLLADVLKTTNVPQIVPQNYFDAFVYDADGVRTVPNADVKAAMGLPASGPGPKPQGAHPLTGFIECPGD